MLNNKGFVIGFVFRILRSRNLLVVTMVLPLVFGGGRFLAAEPSNDSHHSHHSHAAKFSDPAITAPVPDDWESKPIQHQDKYPDADLVISLGQQTHPLFYDLIGDYAKANNLKIVVVEGTCGITSGRLLKKNVDVGAFCCPPGKNDRLPGLKFYSLGIAPIGLIVHPDNPLQNVSSQQAKEIFEGQISQWSEIDPANDKLIKPIGRLHCKTRPGHWRSLLESGDDFSPRLFEVGVIPDMISQVSRNASSIGWETPLMVDFHQKVGDVKVLNIDGHAPSDLEYVLTGKYPLYRSYSLAAWTTKNKTNEAAAKLIAYLQQYIEDKHEEISFIPVSRLRAAGWRFLGEELVGEPVMSSQSQEMQHHEHHS